MASIESDRTLRPEASLRAHVAAILPGLALCLLVAIVAIAVERMEYWMFERSWIDGLVIAILIGTMIRSSWSPSARWTAGICFSAKTVLEIAVVLLGASVSASTIMALGYPMLVGIFAIVFSALFLGFVIGKIVRLPTRMALLIACGNAICGNSAIAAVAPIIGASPRDVAASIAFTAVFGILVVLGLPLLGLYLQLVDRSFGILAGLTVYAVPQVIAATTSHGVLATEIGTLVKLVRVMMLGPVCLIISLAFRRECSADVPEKRHVLRMNRLVPWFIIGFFALSGLRSFDCLPPAVLPPAKAAATLLTLIAMSALGLGVDVRSVMKAGAAVAITVILSLVALGVLSFALIAVLAID